uniref:Uncharacterized protein n=1 Tax=Cuerna arida TaxID=1464854 RepID=A0A1B6GXD5_9HEMI
MKNVNNFVVKTQTSESSGYIIKTISTTTAGPGGCVVIHTEEEKRLVSVKDREDYLVPEIPPTVFHVPIFPSALPALRPTTTEVSTNTECSSISCCTQTSSGPDNPPSSNPPPNPGCAPQPQQPAPGCAPQSQPPTSGCSPQPQQPAQPSTSQGPEESKDQQREVARRCSMSRRNTRAAESSTESDSDYSYSSESESSACWCETTNDTTPCPP